jgi:hypothetical protein
MNASRRDKVELTVANAVQDVNCVPSADFSAGIAANTQITDFHCAATESSACSHHASVRKAVGEQGWFRLPAAVRARFDDAIRTASYEGEFETVRANWPGRLLAFFCRLIRTPIAPSVGVNIPATVRVFENGQGGMVWERTYRFPDRHCIVSSIKQLDADGHFVEALPAGLRMPLQVFERDGALHFVSLGYRFDWLGLHVSVPDALPPGVTHVEHRDEGDGWFRFTMTVTHKWFGEVYFQTGRFKDSSIGTAPIA